METMVRIVCQSTCYTDIKRPFLPHFSTLSLHPPEVSFHPPLPKISLKVFEGIAARGVVEVGGSSRNL